MFFFESDTEVVFATDRPIPLFRIRRTFSGQSVATRVCTAEDIDTVLMDRKPLDNVLQKFWGHGKAAMEMIDEIMLDAMAFRSSDIHFEPTRRRLLFR